ncbi:hypothetical protein BSY16_4992 (plasmid) [Sinorhizobium sp. RAC02]|nr:hypothetical protein BSY16_4992 [Sinorhizobium sp. RAC02]
MLLPIINQEIIDDEGRPIADWSRQIRYVDGAFDGGAGFQGQKKGVLGYGIPLIPATLPNRIRFLATQRVRPLPDVLYQVPQYLATARFRDVVEAMEPGMHQLHPLTMMWKDDSAAPDRWIVHPTQRIDTADRTQTTYVFTTNTARGWSWRDDPSRQDKSIPQARFVIDSSKVAGRHFWVDKYFLVPVHFVSAEFRQACETAKITGLQFTPIGELDWLGVS